MAVAAYAAMIELPDRAEMEDEETLRAWSMTKPRCDACFKDHREAEFADLTGLQTHHMVKRSRRLCHLPWNLLRLCEVCHRLAEGESIPDDRGGYLPMLTFAICLGIKSRVDAGEWRPDLLAELYGFAVPEPEALPEYFVRERQRREPFVPWREL